MTTAILTPRAAVLERIKALVLDTLPSPESKRAYGQALDDFFRWCEAVEVGEFTEATVNAYRASLEELISIDDQSLSFGRSHARRGSRRQRTHGRQCSSGVFAGEGGKTSWR